MKRMKYSWIARSFPLVTLIFTLLFLIWRQQLQKYDTAISTAYLNVHREDGAIYESTTSLNVDPEDDVRYEYNNYGPNINLKVERNRDRNVKDGELKKILFWNNAYGSREYGVGFGRELFYRYKCPETRCYTTSDRKLLNRVSKFDAIVIHQREIDSTDLPKYRSFKQRWIFWVAESASYSSMDISKLNHMFNWTMTYRMDADFPIPYGEFKQIKSHPPRGSKALQELITNFGKANNVHLQQNKTKKSGVDGMPRAAWFVSHCHTKSKREKVTREMRKFMDIDIYGECGKFKCPRSEEGACWEMAERKYNFYLSFENSICLDYVTEKFWFAVHRNIIPVVFSGTFDKFDRHPRRQFPPHSFINVNDYDTIEELVDHIEKVDSNSTLYAEYMWWKDYYEVRDRNEDKQQGFCDLCEKLWSEKEEDQVNVYDDMDYWVTTKSKCKSYRH